VLEALVETDHPVITAYEPRKLSTYDSKVAYRLLETLYRGGLTLLFI
jgi:hypothetical protein